MGTHHSGYQHPRRDRSGPSGECRRTLPRAVRCQTPTTCPSFLIRIALSFFGCCQADITSWTASAHDAPMRDEGASTPAGGPVPGWRGFGGRAVAEGAHGKRFSPALTFYRLALTVPAAVWLGFELARAPADLDPSMLQWIVLLAVVELVATEAWGGPGLSVAFGLQVTVAMLYDPLAAGLIALAGAFEPRELPRAGRGRRRRAGAAGAGVCRDGHADVLRVPVRRPARPDAGIGQGRARAPARNGPGLPLPVPVDLPRDRLVQPAGRAPRADRGALAGDDGLRADRLRPLGLHQGVDAQEPAPGAQRAAGRAGQGAGRAPVPRAAHRGGAGGAEPAQEPARGDGLPRGAHSADVDRRLRERPAPDAWQRRAGQAPRLPRHHRAPGQAPAEPGGAPANGLPAGEWQVRHQPRPRLWGRAVPRGGRGAGGRRWPGRHRAAGRPPGPGHRPPR